MARQMIGSPMPDVGVNKGAGATPTGYRDILQQIAESLKPGGEIAKAQMAEIDQEGKRLGAQLSGSAISKGMGNVTTGIPTTVAKQTGQAKQKARSELLSSYLGVLTNLAGMAFQEEQAAAERSVQTQGANTQGLDAFGKPLTGSLAASELDLANKQMRAATALRPSPQAQPNLYAAAGYGASADLSSAPSLFGDVGGKTAPESVRGDNATVAPAYDPWGPLKGYGETRGGRAVGIMPAKESWEL